MHKCYKCQEYKETENFCKDRSRASGLSSKCKDCMKIANKARLKKNGRAAELSRRWKRNNKAKEQAHKAVARAVKTGKLTKPTECPKCGADKRIEGHHHDYEKKLDVIWLCQSCHLALHIPKWKERYATR